MKIPVKISNGMVMVGGVCIGSAHELDGEYGSVPGSWRAIAAGSDPVFKSEKNAIRYIFSLFEIRDSKISAIWDEDPFGNGSRIKTSGNLTNDTIGNVFNDGTWVANPYNIEGKCGFETMEEAMIELEKILGVEE